MTYKMVKLKGGWGIQNAEGVLLNANPLTLERAKTRLELMITTKPFRSKKQWKWAFANKKKWAEKWAKETPGGKGARYRALPVKTKEHTSVMVAWYLANVDYLHIAEIISRQWDLPTEYLVPASEMHVTMCYLGKTETMAPYAQDVAAAVLNYAVDHVMAEGRRAEPMRMTVGGVARFMTVEDGDTNALVLTVNSPGMTECYERLHTELKIANVPYEPDYGFMPHITIAYLPRGVPTPNITFSRFDIYMRHITLAWGDIQADFPIAPPATIPVYEGGPGIPDSSGIVASELRTAYKAVQDDPTGSSSSSSAGTRTGRNNNARAGQRIAGNLCRTASGKFGKCGAGNAESKAPKGNLPDIKQPKAAKGGGKGGKGAGKGGKGKDAVDKAKLGTEVQQASANAHAVLSGFNIAPDGEQALADLMEGKAADLDSIKRHGFIEAGLVTTDANGAAQLTESGKAMLKAALAGDADKAGAIIKESRDAVKNQMLKDRPVKELKLPVKAAPKATQPAKPKEEDTRVKKLWRQSSVVNVQYPASFKSSPASFSVFKEKTGRLRWFMLSSNSFRDRDGQHVSEKALRADVERTADLTDQGPLRWYHVGQITWDKPGDWTTVKAGPGVDLGRCDFSVMIGKMLLESGTFHNDAIGAKIAAKASALQGSLGFSHPINEPGPDGVYYNIKRFERSLTPFGRASNPLTRLVVKETPMDVKKMGTLKALGLTESEIEELENSALTTQKAAEVAGVSYKEAVRDHSVEALLSQAAALQEQMTLLQQAITNKAAAVESGESDVDTVAEPAEEPFAEEVDPETPLRLADLTVDEFAGLVGDVMREQAAVTTKELQDARLEPLVAQIEQLTVALKEAQDQLAELTDVAPPAVKRAQRPSQQSDNVVPPPAEAITEKSALEASPLAWVDMFVTGQNGNGR